MIPPCLKRLRFARAVLFLSCLLLVIAHLLPSPGQWWGPTDGGWFSGSVLEGCGGNGDYLRYGWRGFYLERGWSDLWNFLPGPARISGRYVAGLFIGLGLIVASLPFLATVLSKSRELWWSMAILVTAMAGRMFFLVGGLGRQAGPGGDICLIGFGLAGLGLILIPRYGAAESPRRRKSIAMAYVIVLLFLVAAPHIFWRQIDQAMGEERMDRGKFQLEMLSSGVLDFHDSTGGIWPTNEEGWQALIERPSRIEEWCHPWEKRLASPPIDPWGRPWRYTLSFILPDLPHDEDFHAGRRARIVSDGPDGLRDTADDLVYDSCPPEPDY